MQTLYATEQEKCRTRAGCLMCLVKSSKYNVMRQYCHQIIIIDNKEMENVEEWMHCLRLNANESGYKEKRQMAQRMSHK